MGYPRKVKVNVKQVKENGAPENKLSFEFVMVPVMLSVVFLRDTAWRLSMFLLLLQDEIRIAYIGFLINS